MICIIDYGMGNIHSVKKALESFGVKTLVTSNPQDLEKADKIILPGVGAFDDAILGLKKKDLISNLIKHIENKKTILGICLGMQLLFEESQEAKDSRGLGILKGRIKKFDNNLSLKIPHIGWNQIKMVLKDCPLLKDIPDNSYVYFCHSYYPEPEDKNIIVTYTDYGLDFASVVWKDNIYGVQFHPEKSQAIGLKIIKNFISLC
ncbi:MAG: imidazole glycerol phosphate synthase subunit HisH [Candidatus Omnitrophica bacterium]|nr:imidazole glycerol phosphate synthase subunit HisH [Candidatus Omnitrophota bacterium]